MLLLGSGVDCGGADGRGKKAPTEGIIDIPVSICGEAGEGCAGFDGLFMGSPSFMPKQY